MRFDGLREVRDSVKICASFCNSSSLLKKGTSSPAEASSLGGIFSPGDVFLPAGERACTSHDVTQDNGKRPIRSYNHLGAANIRLVDKSRTTCTGFNNKQTVTHRALIEQTSLTTTKTVLAAEKGWDTLQLDIHFKNEAALVVTQRGLIKWCDL